MATAEDEPHQDDWDNVSPVLADGGPLPPALLRFTRWCAVRAADEDVPETELELMRLATEVFEELHLLDRIRRENRAA